MVGLGKEHVYVNEEVPAGFREVPGGVVFHFKQGPSILVTDAMADRIHSTVEHLRKLRHRGP